MSTVGTLFPVVHPSYFPTDGDLAQAHMLKEHARHEALVEMKKINMDRRDYLYDIYMKKVHESQIRMEIFNCSTIDFYV